MAKRPKTALSLPSGFRKVEKEEDLRSNIAGLNELFSQALEIESNSVTIPRCKTANSKKRRPRPVTKEQPSSSSSPYDTEALDLLSNNTLLKQRMTRDPIFIQAMKVSGVTSKDLTPLPRSHFNKEPNRPWNVPSKVAQGRFDFFQNHRKNSLIAVLKSIHTHSETIKKDLQDASVRQNNLRSKVKTSVELQKLRVEKMKHAREKYERVLEKEAELLRTRRKEFETKAQTKAAREAAIASRIAEQNAALKQKSLKHQQKLAKAQKTRELADASRIQAAEAKRRYEKTLAANKKIEKKAAISKLLEDTENERKRQAVMAEFKASEAARLKTLEELMEKKQQLLKSMQDARDAKTAAWQEKQRLASQERRSYVNRIRKAKAYENTRALERIEADNAAKRANTNLQKAVLDDQSEAKKQQVIHNDRWKMSFGHPHVSPGPGEYDVTGSLEHTVGGTWGHYRPKSDIEWTIYQAAQKPGPGDYDVPTFTDDESSRGVTFTRSSHKTTTALICEKAELSPGPGAYNASNPHDEVTAVTFSASDTATDFELSLRAAAELPGPADYGAPLAPPKHESLKTLAKKI